MDGARGRGRGGQRASGGRERGDQRADGVGGDEGGASRAVRDVQADNAATGSDLSDVDDVDEVDPDLAGAEPPPPGTKPEALMSAARRALLDQEEDADGSAPAADALDPEKRGKKTCKFFAQSGRCRNGARCGFLHDVGRDASCGIGPG